MCSNWSRQEYTELQPRRSAQRLALPAGGRLWILLGSRKNSKSEKWLKMSQNPARPVHPRRWRAIILDGKTGTSVLRTPCEVAFTLQQAILKRTVTCAQGHVCLIVTDGLHHEQPSHAESRQQSTAGRSKYSHQ
jgi:hypothetical protein